MSEHRLLRENPRVEFWQFSMYGHDLYWPKCSRAATWIASGIGIWVQTKRTRAEIFLFRHDPLRKQAWGAMDREITGSEMDQLYERLHGKGNPVASFGGELSVYDVRITDIPAVVDILVEVLASEP